MVQCHLTTTYVAFLIFGQTDLLPMFTFSLLHQIQLTNEQSEQFHMAFSKAFNEITDLD